MKIFYSNRDNTGNNSGENAGNGRRHNAGNNRRNNTGNGRRNDKDNGSTGHKNTEDDREEKNMEKRRESGKHDLTEMVFILDRSGSMSGLESDTIGGFNGMISKQKNEPGEAVVSTVLFSDYSKVIHNRVDIRDIGRLTEREYCVGGCTALLDAVGGAIDHIRNIRENMDRSEIPDKTIFVIITDGQENSSKEYTYASIKKMIERQQEKFNWEFIFLGANMDAVAEAGRYGIKASRAATYNCDSEGTELSYSVIGKTISKVRACKTAADARIMLDDIDCLCEVREDSKRRSQKRH